MKRALRRHHRNRLRKNRRFHWNRWLSPQELSKVIDTPTLCSCSMCGNPRKFHKEKTHQELIFEEKEEYQIMEYFMLKEAI